MEYIYSMPNDKTLRVTLDISELQEADDGNTTHWGGTVAVDGVKLRAWGNDRSDSWHDDLVETLKDKLVAAFPDLDVDDEDVELEIAEIAIDLVVEAGPFATAEFNVQDGRLTVAFVPA